MLGEGFGNPTFARRCARPSPQFRQFAVLVVPWTVTHAPPVASHKRLDASRDAVDNLAAPDERTGCFRWSVRAGLGYRKALSRMPHSGPYRDFARDVYAGDRAVAVVAPGVTAS